MSVAALRSPRSSLEIHLPSGAKGSALAACVSSSSGSASVRRPSPLCSVTGKPAPAAAPRPAPSAAQQQSRRRAPLQPCRSAYASFSSFSSFSSIDSDSDDESYGPWREKLFVGGLVDYYAVLQVDDDATVEEIKKAYRALAKTCHPDLLGDDGHNICIMLNEAYTVLSDPAARQKYNTQLEQALKDDEDDFDPTKPLSKWIPTVKPKMAKNTDPNENRAVFVDEFTCIGCKNCAFIACATFRIEPEHGRSRVYAQWLDTEENITAAIDSCPVSCIHWVRKDDLPALEYVMQRRMTQRTNVGIMMAGQGATGDVWAATDMFLKERRRLQEAQERASRQRAYSPAQEQARRAAVNAMRKKSLGVFAKFGEVMDSIAEQLQATVSGKAEDMVTVGKRKRTVRWDEARRGPSSPAPEGQDWYLVPPERALVPVSIRSD